MKNSVSPNFVFKMLFEKYRLTFKNRASYT